MVLNAEEVAQKCFVKKVVLQISKIHRKEPVIASPKEEALAQV